MSTEQTLTSAADDRGAQAETTGDPVGLLHELEASGRFVRDSGLGRILHPGKGKISYRQAVPENSLHIVINGNRVSAHIDRFSPLAFDANGRAYYSLRRAVRYSLRRILTHNLASIADIAWAVVSGDRADHRREFHCQRTDPHASTAVGTPAGDERA